MAKTVGAGARLLARVLRARRRARPAPPARPVRGPDVSRRKRSAALTSPETTRIIREGVCLDYGFGKALALCVTLRDPKMRGAAAAHYIAGLHRPQRAKAGKCKRVVERGETFAYMRAMERHVREEKRRGLPSYRAAVTRAVDVLCRARPGANRAAMRALVQWLARKTANDIAAERQPPVPIVSDDFTAAA